MKKTAGYSIKDNTIVLTKAYAKLAYTPGTKEFRELSALHQNFPDFPIVMRTATKNEDKEKFTDLTLDRMEYFIKCFKNDKALEEFQNAKKFYKGTKGYYGKMKKWFLDKYKNDYLDADFSKVKPQNQEENSAEEQSAEVDELAIAV